MIGRITLAGHPNAIMFRQQLEETDISITQDIHE
jgi:hypothetical protein